MSSDHDQGQRLSLYRSGELERRAPEDPVFLAEMTKQANRLCGAFAGVDFDDETFEELIDIGKEFDLRDIEAAVSEVRRTVTKLAFGENITAIFVAKCREHLAARRKRERELRQAQIEPPKAVSFTELKQRRGLPDDLSLTEFMFAGRASAKSARPKAEHTDSAPSFRDVGEVPIDPEDAKLTEQRRREQVERLQRSERRSGRSQR